MMAILLIWITGFGFSPEGTASENEGRKESTLVIRTGTTFGRCIGYCIHSVQITPEKIEFYQADQRKRRPKITGTRRISEETWQALTALIELEEFTALPEVVGCPDCDDGGMEWIEISYGDTTKRVEFEYHTSIPKIDGLIKMLREIRETARDVNN